MNKIAGQKLVDFIRCNDSSMLEVLEQVLKEHYLRAFDDGYHHAASILLGDEIKINQIKY